MRKEFGHSLYSYPFEGRVHPDYDKAHVISFLSRCPVLKKDPAFRTLLDSRNLVGVVPLPVNSNKSIDVVVKEYRTLGIDTLKTLVIPSKALKAWRGAAALLYANIPTPFPIAYLERKKRRITKQGFYMSEWIDAAEEIRSLFHDLPDPLLTVLIQELAIQIRNWHDKGILHRDLSDGNILVKKNKSGRPQFYLTDTNRIRVKKRIRPFKRVKNLIRLGVPSRFQKKFLALYTDKPEGRGLLWMWYCLNKRTFIFYIQLKKYLRLKKIVRMLRLQ